MALGSTTEQTELELKRGGGKANKEIDYSGIIKRLEDFFEEISQLRTW